MKLLLVLIFLGSYKVAVDTELANAEPLLLELRSLLSLLVSAFILVNSCPFLRSVWCQFFFFFCISVLSLLMTSLFKMAPICSTEVLCSVRKCRKAVMWLWEKTHTLDMLHSGMSYNKNMALNRMWKGHVFTIWKEEKRRQIISCWLDLSWVI